MAFDEELKLNTLAELSMETCPPVFQVQGFHTWYQGVMQGSGSNPDPHVCKASTLATELHPQVHKTFF